MGLLDTIAKMKASPAAAAPAPAAPATPPAAPPAPPAPVAVAAPPPPAPVAPAPAQAAAPTPAASGAIAVAACQKGEVYKLADGFAEFVEHVGPFGLFKLSTGAVRRVKNVDTVGTLEGDSAAPAPVVAPQAPAPIPVGVLPPDAPASDPKLAAKVEEAPKAPEPAPAPATTPAAEAPKRGPGRPKKALTPPVAAAVVTLPAGEIQTTGPITVSGNVVVKAPEAAAPQVDDNTDGAEASQVAPVVRGLELFVNCVPNGAHGTLDAYVAGLAGQLCKAFGLDDVRLADREHGGDGMMFGKWAGALAALARENPPEGRQVIWSSALADPVVEALAPLASLVVRGR